jgi:hypothetical protein
VQLFEVVGRLLLQSTARSACRGSNPQRILAVGQTNAAALDQPVERMAMELLESFTRVPNIFKLE